MKLITKAIEKATPPLYSNENKKSSDIMVTAKFFNPYGAAVWYMTEYDPQTKTAFGYCDLGFGSPELGYFSLTEMEEIRIKPFGFKIERDRYFTPIPLQTVLNHYDERKEQ